MKKKYTDKELEEMISKTKKSKKTKKKYADGGATYDPSILSDEDQQRISQMSKNEQDAYLKEKSIEVPKETISAEVANQGDTDTLSSIPVVGSIISAAGGILDEVSGEVDPKTGKSETKVQAGMQGMSNSTSFANVGTGIEQISEGEVGQGLLNILMPWAGEISNQDINAIKLKQAEEKQIAELGQTAYYKSKDYAEGGKVKEGVEPEPKIITTDQKLKAIEGIETLQKANDLKLIPPEGWGNMQYGSDAQGKPLTKLEKREHKVDAIITPDESRKLTSTSTSLIASELLGMDQKTFNKQYKEDPEATLKTMNDSLQKMRMEGKTDRKFEIVKNKDGSIGFSELIPNKNKSQELAEGGEVQGAGTGKSDSISASIPEGSFIIPADVNKEIIKRIKDIMGYDKADIKQPDGVDVKLSDGELYIPPEDVQQVNQIVQKMGFEGGLNELAPNAETKLQEGIGYADGYAGYLGGAAQILLSLSESSKNKEPENITPQLLQQLAAEVKKRASYGMNPYERTEAENAMQRNIETQKEMIKESSGGSIDMYMNNAAAMRSGADSSRLALEATSSKLQDEKLDKADKMQLEYINAVDRDFGREYDKYLKNEDTAAALMDAGWSNVIGQGQYNKYNEALLTPEERKVINDQKAAKKAKNKAKLNEFWRKDEEEIVVPKTTSVKKKSKTDLFYENVDEELGATYDN